MTALQFGVILGMLWLILAGVMVGGIKHTWLEQCDYLLEQVVTDEQAVTYDEQCIVTGIHPKQGIDYGNH